MLHSQDIASLLQALLISVCCNSTFFIYLASLVVIATDSRHLPVDVLYQNVAF